MSVIIRQSTARTIIVGPILDENGVAVTTAAVGDLKISKNGAAPAALNVSATLTHRNTGHYSLALTTSDTDTVGQAEVVIDKTTDAMPLKVLTVMEEAVYDAFFAASATGLLPATAVAIATAVWDRVVSKSNHNIANSAGRYLRTIVQAVGSGAEGTVNADGSETTISFKTNLNKVDNFYNDQLIVFTTGDLTGQANMILTYANIDGVIIFDEGWTSAPANGDEFIVTPIHVHPKSQIVDAILDELLAGHATAGTLGKAVSDILADTSELQVDDIPGLIAALNDPTVGAVADAVWDESAADHTTSGSFGQQLQDVYHADIQLTIDGANTQDEYTITWFNNGARVTSGITLPTIQVVKRSDGTDLIAEDTPTEIGSIGSFKYDETSNRITNGEAVLVLVGATIGGSVRTFSKLLGRDASS